MNTDNNNPYLERALNIKRRVYEFEIALKKAVANIKSKNKLV
jgi:hypothetical protein